jgi:outer membrane protein
MKKIILSTLCASLLTVSAQADTLGVEAGMATWSTSFSGSIKGKYMYDTNIDLENTLGYGSQVTNSFFWVYLDHPVPLLPNIKIQQTNFTDSASKAISTGIKFDNKSYDLTVNSEITLNQTDIIAYWRILDNWINFDLGLNLKTIDGNVKLDAVGSTPTNKNFKATIPMLYVKGKFDLPFTGLSAEADISYISYSGSKLTDFKAGLVYQTSFGLGANAGLRSQNFVIDNIDDFNSDISISGGYLGVFYHF